MADNHDDEQHNVQFEGTSSGASLTFPMQCSALRKNGHVVIKGRPCKIVDMSTSKTGKHGHAKVHLVAIDIFTGKKLEDLSPSTHNMDVPNIKRVEYTLVNIDDGFLNLLDADSNQKDDVKVPEGELGTKMEADFEDGKDVSLLSLPRFLSPAFSLSPRTAVLSIYFFNDTKNSYRLFHLFFPFSLAPCHRHCLHG